MRIPGAEFVAKIFYDPAFFFELQKGYIPQSVLIRLLESENVMDAYIRGWQSYLYNLASKGNWRLAGDVESDDFVASMMTGHIPSKDMIQHQGGVSSAQRSYDPTRGGQRPTICPSCSSSFWSCEHGNANPAFKHWNIHEYRDDHHECPPPIKLTVNGVEKKACGKILAGPFVTRSEAEPHCQNHNQPIEIDQQWYVVCGHPIDLMSYYNYVHTYIMRPLRAEHYRYVTARTKGRMNVVQGFNCPICSQSNEANISEDNTSEFAEFYQCCHCNTRFRPDDLTLFTIEKGNLSLSTPVGDDGKATIGDMLASPQMVDEELQQVEASITNTLDSFTQLLQSIVNVKHNDAQSRFKDRRFTKIPALERSLQKAKLRNDLAKVKEVEQSLAREQENLIKDQNKIDYTSNLVEMFKLHFVGDSTGQIWDYRRLTEHFMFKSKPYTVCNDCNHRDFEQNETGKIERDYEEARDRLKELARQGKVPGYDAAEILNTPSDKLLPHLGSTFYCSKCNSTHLSYYGPGMKNPSEPRIEITPHIFQPAQREIDELKAEVFAYKMCCPACGFENQIRPDKMTGKLLDYKISKRTVEEDGKRKAVREKAEHTCAKCNHILTLDDVITSSNAQDAYSLLVNLRELLDEREKLRIAKRNGGDSGWSIQS